MKQERQRQESKGERPSESGYLPAELSFTGTVLTFILLMPNGMSENIIVAAHILDLL